MGVGLRRVGFVGWRGMVGSVLLQRMQAEKDFERIEEAVFFSTSQTGQAGPEVGRGKGVLRDAFDLEALGEMDVVVSCQGGGYTETVHEKLRGRGWEGYWVDAASTLRMTEGAVLVLDAVNREVIDAGLAAGKKDFIGGNCTVSLMMMALDGLFKAGVVRWVTVATYQAISGAGARAMQELVRQMGGAYAAAEEVLDGSALGLEEAVTRAVRGGEVPVEEIGGPLVGSLLPWVDRDLGGGLAVRSGRQRWRRIKCWDERDRRRFRLRVCACGWGC